jgi:hypothetical protein
MASSSRGMRLQDLRCGGEMVAGAMRNVVRERAENSPDMIGVPLTGIRNIWG